MTKTSIALLGYYGHSNFGDNLLAYYLSEYLTKYGDVTVYSDRYEEWQCENGLLDKSFLDKDLIVIGGGSLVTPSYWVFKENLAGKQIVFLNVNVGDITDMDFRAKLQNLNAKWFVRDSHSVECLKNIGIKSVFVPDIVSSIELEPVDEKRLITVFMNSYIFNKMFSDNKSESMLAHKNIIELAKYLDWMMHFDWKVEIIPCQLGGGEFDDRICSSILYGHIKNKNKCKMLFSGLPHWQLISKIQESQFVISSRFHTTLVAAMAQRNFIDITHHDKNKMFLEDNKLSQNSVDYYLFNKESLISKTQFIESQTNIKTLLSTKKIWDNLDILK